MSTDDSDYMLGDISSVESGEESEEETVTLEEPEPDTMIHPHMHL
jgi:hypothetical protein